MAPLHSSLLFPILLLLLPLPLSATPASFTWYTGCAPSHKPACGDTYNTTEGQAQGYAATNRQNFESAAGACGTCWRLTPLSNPNPSNGNNFGGPVTVMISDECSDGGYCDQAGGKPNTKFQRPLHFDLCTHTAAADALFGDRAAFGQLLGTAERVACGGVGLPPAAAGAGSGAGNDTTAGSEGGDQSEGADTANAGTDTTASEPAAQLDADTVQETKNGDAVGTPDKAAAAAGGTNPLGNGEPLDSSSPSVLKSGNPSQNSKSDKKPQKLAAQVDGFDLRQGNVKGGGGGLDGGKGKGECKKGKRGKGVGVRRRKGRRRRRDGGV